MAEPIVLPLPDIELPEVPELAPDTPRVTASEVTHDQILDVIMARLGAIEETITLGFDGFHARLQEGDRLFVELRVEVNKVANNQHEESRVLSETLHWSQENGRKLDGLKMLHGNLAGEVLELRQRLPTLPPPTIPAPPPELDADERTTPGHRVPSYGGDPGHE